jgi:ornithine decarboxylase
MSTATYQPWCPPSSSWRPDFSRVEALASTHPTPFLLINPLEALGVARELESILGGVRYAIKAGPHPQLLAELAAAGFGFDIASAAELDLAVIAGCSPEKLLCANPALPCPDTKTMLNAGVRHFVADSAQHMEMLARTAEAIEIAPTDLRVLIRLNFSDEEAHIPLAGKFGVTPEDGIALAALAAALGLSVAGASFHLGSQASSLMAAHEAATGALEFVTNLGITSPIVDVGGGFPAPYHNAPKWQPFAQALAAPLRGRVEIYCEPGRLLASVGSTLVAQVVSVAARGGRNYAHLDAGAYHGLLEFSGQTKTCFETDIAVMLTGEPSESRPTYLVGPTCDSVDTIFPGTVDIPNLVIGDIVLFSLAGAYSTSCSSPFNGFSVPATHAH